MFPNGIILHDTYEIRERIGHGGGGAVYAAYDIKLRKMVALKHLHLEGDHAIKAFGHEASLLANLQHPSLPKVYLHFTANDSQFLVMDLIDGADLSSMLERQGGPLPVEQVLAWADQLLSVLTYLHTFYRQPIVHRDIKPANIKITSRGELKLLDFGLAKAEIFTNMKSAMHSVHGYTLTYAPPEQINQEGTDPRSDLYSLGATLYHLLTGRTPADGDGKTADALARTLAMAKRKPDPIIDPQRFNPSIPDHVNQAIMRSLEIDADERFASAEEFRLALAQPYAPVNNAQTKILPSTISSRAITGSAKPPTSRDSQPNPSLRQPNSSYPVEASAEALPQPQPTPSYKRFWPLLLIVLLGGAGGGWWLNRDAQLNTDSDRITATLMAKPSQGVPPKNVLAVADQPTVTLDAATSEPTTLASDHATATSEPNPVLTATSEPAQPTNANLPATARPAATNRPATARPAATNRPAPTNPPAVQPTNLPVEQPTSPPVAQPTNPPVDQPINPSVVVDTDGDTIPDDRDACPREPGDPSRNGCPKPKEQPTNLPQPTIPPPPLPSSTPVPPPTNTPMPLPTTAPPPLPRP